MSHTRREYLGAAGGALAMTIAAGCLTEGDPGQELDPDADDVDLLLNWRPSGLHVPYYTAVERGFYEDHGLEVSNIESGQGSDFSATQVGLDNVEFGVSSSDQVLNVTGEGLAPVCVGVIMQRGPIVLFTDRNQFGEEIREPAQLEGVTLGSGPGMVRMMATAYLEYHGLGDGIEFVDAGSDIVQQLLTGEVDAAAGVFSDVVDARHQNATIDSLHVADDIPFYGHVITTSQSFLEEYPDTVRAFLQGTARGAAWAANDVEGGTDILIDAVPELEVARENQRDKWDVLREEYLVSKTVEEQGWGWSEGDVWATTAEILLDHNFLEEEVDPDAVWTNDLLDTNYPYIGDFADEYPG